MEMSMREWVVDLFNEYRYASCDRLADLMTLQDAERDLENFRRDGYDIPEDMTAEDYMLIWNELVWKQAAGKLRLLHLPDERK